MSRAEEGGESLTGVLVALVLWLLFVLWIGVLLVRAFVTLLVLLWRIAR